MLQFLENVTDKLREHMQDPHSTTLSCFPQTVVTYFKPFEKSSRNSLFSHKWLFTKLHCNLLLLTVIKTWLLKYTQYLQ